MNDINSVRELVTGVDNRVAKIEGWLELIMQELRPQQHTNTTSRSILTNLIRRKRKLASVDLDLKAFKEDE